jgi:UDP-N-acetylmuramyl pentapeptide synthase
MKTFLKSLVAAILGWQVRRLYKKKTFKVVAVAGSVGKTSTKLAIAQVLSQSFAVQYQKGNYNDLVSVPLIFFGQSMPSLFNPLAWLAIFWKNERIIFGKYPYEIVVVELGTDQPGDMPRFKAYLRADLGVITGITPEHMEYFGSMDAVAQEELVLEELSNELMINADLSEASYLKRLKGTHLSYGTKSGVTYRLSQPTFKDEYADFTVSKGQTTILRATHEAISEPQLLSVTAAVAVGDQLGMVADDIEQGIRNIRPVSGRMQRLEGINGSTIIDDSYNASPAAVRAALDTLYRVKAPQKIAVLGNMNELGEYSKEMHEQVGQYCDPHKLNLVVTIGPDANRYLAEAAKAKGCQVESFDSPVTAGEHIKPLVKKGAVILVKGSQNRVFSEETVKQLLANPADARKLVRQSKDWLKIKRRAFSQ